MSTPAPGRCYLMSANAPHVALYITSTTLHSGLSPVFPKAYLCLSGMNIH